jgi:hypothetical protein
MTSESNVRWLRRLCRIYRLMLLAYPFPFRREFGREMEIAFRTQAREVMQTRSVWQLAPFVLRITCDWVNTVIDERRLIVHAIRTLRWLAALPLAIVAAAVASRTAGLITIRYLRESPSSFWVLTAITFFLMSSAFVSVGIWVAPNRKDSVARIALGVVVGCGALVMALSTVAMAATPFVWGLSTLLGGVVSYLALRPLLLAQTRRRNRALSI